MDKALVNSILFKPHKLGDLTLKNRVVMAAMTRCRADPKTGIPTELHAQYYSQRASAGLILTECTPVAKNGFSFLGSGGLYTKEQIEGWKKATRAVHAKGSVIFAQIWHAGRAAIPSLIGEQNIGPSPIAISGSLFRGLDYAVPKEMTKDDIKQVIEQFRQGALNAKEAGFDGLELHGANGYLVDNFLRSSSNKRTDEYGGSAENRSRFCLEVIDALISVYGAKRVGIKLSPVGRYQDMYDENPFETYSYLLKQLDKRGIAFVELAEIDPPNSSMPKSDIPSPAPQDQMPEVTKTLRPYFRGTIIINNGLTAETAADAISSGLAELASFGKNYITNPDLVERMQNGWELNKDLDFTTMYNGGEKGYTDYPFHPNTSLVNSKKNKKSTGCFGFFSS